MCKVKTQFVLIVKGTCLLNMGTEDNSQCLLQQMSCTMVLGCVASLLFVDGKLHNIALLEHTACYNTDMANLAAQKFNDILNLKCTFRTCDHTCICHLTTACRIERCLLCKDRTCLTVCQGICQFCLCCQNSNWGFTLCLLITHKHACH